jgi:hypothetical protein
MKNVTNFQSAANLLGPNAFIIRSTRRLAWLGISLWMIYSWVSNNIHRNMYLCIQDMNKKHLINQCSMLYLHRNSACLCYIEASFGTIPITCTLRITIQFTVELTKNILMKVDKIFRWIEQWMITIEFNEICILASVTTVWRLSSPPILNKIELVEN